MDVDITPWKTLSPSLAVLKAALIYPIIFLSTIPLWLIGHRYKDYVSQNKPLQFMNMLFVDWGPLWFSVAYLGQLTNLTGGNRIIKSQPAVRLILRYVAFVFITLVFHGGVLGVLIVEVVNSATGGHCAGAELAMQACKKNINSKWVDGFDISSHYFALLSQSLLLFHAILVSYRENGSGSGETASINPVWRRKILNLAVKIFARVLAVLLSIWTMEFCITSVFFHTITERLIGLFGVPAALAVVKLDDRFFAEFRIDHYDQDTFPCDELV